MFIILSQQKSIDLLSSLPLLKLSSLLMSTMESCYLRRSLFTEAVTDQSHPFWDTSEQDRFLLELRKTKSYTRLYSCRHGRRLDVFPFSEPVTAGFVIPENSLATTPVECIVDILQDQDLELSQQEIERIAGFMVEMRSRMSPGTRVMAVAEIGICVFEHLNECVLDIPLTDSRTMDSEVRQSESDLEDNAVKSLLARMRYEYKNGIGDDDCSICLGKFFEGDELARTPCSHMFHQDCLGPWFIRRNNCPLCRTEIQF